MVALAVISMFLNTGAQLLLNAVFFHNWITSHLKH